jgi:hypothetical protein
MSTAQTTAQQLAVAPPIEGNAIFMRLTAKERVEVIAAAAELGSILICTVRCAAFARALKTLPELSALPDEQWFAVYSQRQVRLRHAWNAELDDPIPPPFGAAVAVVVVRRTVAGLQRTPLMVSAQWATDLTRPGISDAEVESLIGSVKPLPGVVVRSDVKAVR